MLNSIIPSNYFKPLTSDQLNHSLATDPYFIGVYPRDLLPKTIDHRPPFTLIVNTDTSNLGGEHWVAVFVDDHYHGEYFDSLAQPIPQHIELWLSRFSTQWKYVLRPFIDPPIQNVYTQTCGAFTFYFVHRRPLLDSYRRVLTPFHRKNLRANDHYVVSYLLSNKK